MPVDPSDKNCVRDEMKRFNTGNLHSGKTGKVVTNRRQAVAIALSACGKSKFAESLEGLGFSQGTADSLVLLMSEDKWDRQFETGSTGNKQRRENKVTKAVGLPGMDIDSKPGKQLGEMGKTKNESQESLSHVAIPKGNPQPGPRSLQLKGLRSFEEVTQGLTPDKVCPPKKAKSPKTAETAKPITETETEGSKRSEEVEEASTRKAETQRKRCTPQTVGITG